MSLSSMVRDFELRFIRASAAAGITEFVLMFLQEQGIIKWTPHSIWGYFGTGLILYSVFHYVQIRSDKHGKERKR